MNKIHASQRMKFSSVIVHWYMKRYENNIYHFIDICDMILRKKLFDTYPNKKFDIIQMNICLVNRRFVGIFGGITTYIRDLD